MDGVLIVLVLIVVIICIIGFVIYDNASSLSDAKYVIMATDKQRDNDSKSLSSQFKNLSAKTDTIAKQQDALNLNMTNSLSVVKRSLQDAQDDMKSRIDMTLKNTETTMGTMPSDIAYLKNEMANVKDVDLDFTKKNLIAHDTLSVGADVKLSETVNSAVMAIANKTFAFRNDGTFGTGTTAPLMGIDVNNTDMSKLGLNFTEPNSKKKWSIHMRKDKEQTPGEDGGLTMSSDLVPEPVGVMHFARSGKIGMGTSAPLAKLDVVGDLRVGNNVKSGSMNIDNTSGAFYLGGNDKTDLVLKSNNTGRMVITSGNNNTTRVGVGTGVPQETLHVSENIRADGTDIKLGGDKRVLGRDATGTFLEEPTFNPLTIKTNGKERVVVAATGETTLNGATTINSTLNVVAKDTNAMVTPSITSGSILLSNNTMLRADSSGKLTVCDAKAGNCRQL